ncbi:chaperonin 10-like protein [Xylaria nigripes]|nr:chaperonin 10-like protein [Xylaria nigripes]
MALSKQFTLSTAILVRLFNDTNTECAIFHRYYDPRDVRLEKLPEPKCPPAHVKIRPAFVGICGSDLHLYQAQTFTPKQGMPVTLGHEFAGVIIEIGLHVFASRRSSYGVPAAEP